MFKPRNDLETKYAWACTGTVATEWLIGMVMINDVLYNYIFLSTSMI